MNLFTNREQQILTLFSRDTDKAMNALYEEYADYLAGVCGRYVRREDQLKDVLQESFIKIFTQIDRFEYRGRGSLKAWMTRIVINESLDTIKLETTNNIVELSKDLIDVADESPETVPITTDALEALILELPPGYRAVFNLYVVEGMSHREIGRRLGIKPATSASQFYHARNMLAEKIKNYKQKHEI